MGAPQLSSCEVGAERSAKKKPQNSAEDQSCPLVQVRCEVNTTQDKAATGEGLTNLGSNMVRCSMDPWIIGDAWIKTPLPPVAATSRNILAAELLVTTNNLTTHWSSQFSCD
jgi:hypothetical protein